MLEIDYVRQILIQLGVLAIAAGGLLLVIAGATPFGKRWCGRMFLLGLLSTTVAHFITPGWLP